MSNTVGKDLLLEAVAKRPLWDLKPRSFDVLCRMCATALDREHGHDPGRLYYGGWIPLAMMLGYPAPDEGEPLEGAGKQAVRRAIADLTRAGLIKTVASSHRNQAYRITL
jgi:hypothetical protein